MFASGGRGKIPLRTILDKYIPKHLIDRPKMGFAIPIHEMLRGPLRDWAESLLSTDSLKNADVFDPMAVKRLWAEHIAGKRNNVPSLWPILMFLSWMEERKA